MRAKLFVECISANNAHPELIVKYNVGLKTFLHQGVSEPVFTQI